MGAILGLDRAALDRARISRDPRFDGKFFIAVTSTGVYCRPVCPSRASNSANVRYYATAAEAAEAGFRPCLRCRPEAAPGTPAWLGTSAVVRRALKLIDDGALDETSVDALAADLGIGPRHLHRLFVQHVGASPMTVAQTRRVHFAKRLLDDTTLPITHIALAAGFGSLRRFNSAFRHIYGRAPRELRRQRGGGPADEVILRLAFRPPYDWDGVRACLAARALPGVERVDARGYARTVAADGGHAIVRVRPIGGERALELSVCGAAPGDLFRLSSAARRMFDLAADPPRIARAFEADELLAPLARARPGLRIAGAWDAFEHAVRALVGDRPGAAAAVVARAGRAIAPAADGLTHVFPSPAALATADLDGLGLPPARAAAVHALARAVAGGALDLAGPSDRVVAELAALPGFGADLAEDVALLALGEPDAFPAGDVALRRAAAAGGAPPLTARALAARAEAWRPWRGYAACLLRRAR
jgi:AraC family transcriptional regulator of adaptative response / DNA-3-methyladenine glycosylase II